VKERKHAAIKRQLVRYTPSEVIVNYIEERLRLDKQAEERTIEGKAAMPEYAKKDASLRRRKNYVLDKAFQAMADLTYFIETIAASQRLQELFTDDLNDLFGLREHTLDWNDPRSKIVFGRLLEAVVNGYSNREKGLPDHAMKLTHIMQMKVFEKVHNAASTNFKTAGAGKNVSADIQRAVAWSEEFALRHQGDYDKPDRVFDIPTFSG
jgi:hypothetical protein